MGIYYINGALPKLNCYALYIRNTLARKECTVHLAKIMKRRLFFLRNIRNKDYFRVINKGITLNKHTIPRRSFSKLLDWKKKLQNYGLIYHFFASTIGMIGKTKKW